MFSFFKKKSKLEILQKQYEKFLKESYELSKTNRTESDKKFVAAQEIMAEIENYKR